MQHKRCPTATTTRSRAFSALGGGDFDARASAVCGRLGLGVELERPVEALSGGERARVSLAAILLATGRAAPSRRADERPGRRRARMAGRVRRLVSRGDRRRLARPRIPRSHGGSDRRGGTPLARDYRVRGRLVGVRPPARRGTRRCVRDPRSRRGAPARPHLAPVAAPDGRTRPRRRGRPPRDARALDEGSAGRTAARAEPAAGEALRALGAPTRAALDRPAPVTRRQARRRGGRAGLVPPRADRARGRSRRAIGVRRGERQSARPRCSSCCSAFSRPPRAPGSSAGGSCRA